MARDRSNASNNSGTRRQPSRVEMVLIVLCGLSVAPLAAVAGGLHDAVRARDETAVTALLKSGVPADDRASVNDAVAAGEDAIAAVNRQGIQVLPVDGYTTEVRILGAVRVVPGEHPLLATATDTATHNDMTRGLQPHRAGVDVIVSGSEVIDRNAVGSERCIEVAPGVVTQETDRGAGARGASAALILCQ